LGFDLPLFYLFAVVAVVASMLVIGQRSPIYSVMLLIASFVALAGLYVLLDAPFVAVIQIIIYAGAILVLFLFVVMLLNAPKEAGGPWQRLAAGPRRLGAALGLVFAVELVWAIWRVASLREPSRWSACCPPRQSSRCVRSVRCSTPTTRSRSR
jgi:NADH-quinone oxidoreductase subunit J